VQIQQQHASGAESFLREGSAIREKAAPDGWSRYAAMCLPGRSLPGRGRYAEAEPRVVAGEPEQAPDGPSVAELAERIGALREANTVEAAPERTARKAARAERPVVARIRERAGERSADAVQEPVAVRAESKPEFAQKPEEPPATAPAALIAIPEPIRNGDAKAMVRRRQGNETQLWLL
jgi:hypothetical protein